MRVQKISFKSRKEYLHDMNSEDLALKRYPKHTRCLLDRVIRTHERILYEELERYVFIKHKLSNPLLSPTLKKRLQRVKSVLKVRQAHRRKTMKRYYDCYSSLEKYDTLLSNYREAERMVSRLDNDASKYAYFNKHITKKDSKAFRLKKEGMGKYSVQISKMLINIRYLRRDLLNLAINIDKKLGFDQTRLEDMKD